MSINIGICISLQTPYVPKPWFSHCWLKCSQPDQIQQVVTYNVFKNNKILTFFKENNIT